MIPPSSSGRPISLRPTLLGAFLVLAALMHGPAALAVPDGDEDDGRTMSDAHTMIVTSDSRTYCRSLSTAIDAYGSLPREVRDLKTEGDGMCSEGRVRGGIARLRRALMVLHKEPPADAPASR